MGDYLRTLFLHPPSFQGFDGGAGSRYQARREIRSFWYPAWLAQPAALVPGSRLVDAPPAGLTRADVVPLARDYELAVLHTSTPSFVHDVETAEALKQANPALRIGFVGAHVAVLPAPRPCGDLRLRRGVLPALLLPAAEDRRDRLGDGARPGSRPAAAEGGRRVPQISHGAPMSSPTVTRS